MFLGLQLYIFWFRHFYVLLTGQALLSRLSFVAGHILCALDCVFASPCSTAVSCAQWTLMTDLTRYVPRTHIPHGGSGPIPIPPLTFSAISLSSVPPPIYISKICVSLVFAGQFEWNSKQQQIGKRQLFRYSPVCLQLSLTQQIVN